MKHAMDFKGQTVGKLTVLERAQDKLGCYGQPLIQWLCECECGTQVLRRPYHLKRGNCMCEKCKAIVDAQKFGYEGIRQHHWYNIQKQAKKRKIEIDITLEYIWDLYEQQNRKCALSGLSIIFAETKLGHRSGETNASLDRKDSSIGYVKGNVQWLHKWINLMKLDFTQQEFINYCQLIVEKNGANEKTTTTTTQNTRR